jgi:hypothetical protein
MRRLSFLLMLVLVPVSFAQTPAAKLVPPATLRSVLLAQLQTTHNKAEWFVPVNAAVAGLTSDQAKWIPLNAKGKLDPENNHSVGMLTYHLLFWNSRALEQMKGEKPGAGPKDNDETFNNFDAASWTKTVHDLDAVLTGLEEFVTNPAIAHITTHNAYHTGQILYVRKLQGSWNPANGVK